MTGQKYSRRQKFMAPILTRPGRSDRRDHLEEAWALLGRSFHQLGAGDRGLNIGPRGQVRLRDPAQIGRRDLEEPLLELLALLAGEAGEPVGGLAPAFDVGRLQWVDIAT